MRAATKGAPAPWSRESLPGIRLGDLPGISGPEAPPVLSSPDGYARSRDDVTPKPMSGDVAKATVAGVTATLNRISRQASNVEQLDRPLRVRILSAIDKVARDLGG